MDEKNWNKHSIPVDTMMTNLLILREKESPVQSVIRCTRKRNKLKSIISSSLKKIVQLKQ